MVEWADMSGLRPEGGEKRPKRVNCFKCVYFKVTWDSRFPRGCDFFDFAGPEMPSETVRKTTGRICPAFTPKTEK
jgi:hypothetical protein